MWGMNIIWAKLHNCVCTVVQLYSCTVTLRQGSTHYTRLMCGRWAASCQLSLVSRALGSGPRSHGIGRVLGLARHLTRAAHEAAVLVAGRWSVNTHLYLNNRVADKQQTARKRGRDRQQTSAESRSSRSSSQHQVRSWFQASAAAAAAGRWRAAWASSCAWLWARPGASPGGRNGGKTVQHNQIIQAMWLWRDYTLGLGHCALSKQLRNSVQNSLNSVNSYIMEQHTAAWWTHHSQTMMESRWWWM